MAGAPSALRLAGVTHHYGRRPVLLDVTLGVGPGEAVALLGANGAGKTTLLRIAATLFRPGAGTVEVAGVDAAREPERARARLGYLGQQAPLYDELGAREHLRWWLRLHRRPLEGIDSTLEAAGLSASAHRPAGTLSRGQRQRLALTLATAHDPPLLLLDEPFTALDEAGRAWLAGLLQARRGRAATLFTHHDRDEAAGLADRTLHLRHRRLEAGP